VFELLEVKKIIMVNPVRII